VAHLRGRELVIADDQIDAGFIAGRRQFAELAPPEEGRRVGLRPLLDQAEARRTSGSGDEPGEFLEGLLGLVPAALGRGQSNQRGAFAGVQGVTPGKTTTSDRGCAGVRARAPRAARSCVDRAPCLQAF
jgi:hypothetical protein